MLVGMKRYLENFLLEDLQTKIVLLTGPRQTGKTTLSRMLKESFTFMTLVKLLGTMG